MTESVKALIGKHRESIASLTFNNKKHCTSSEISPELKLKLNELKVSITQNKSNVLISINDTDFYAEFRGEKAVGTKEAKPKVIALRVMMTNELLLTAIILVDYINTHLNLYSTALVIRFLFLSENEDEVIKQYALLNNASAIYCLLYQPIPLNSFQCETNEFNRKDEFEVTINGKGGHSSLPHLAHNPITAGTEIVMRFKKMSSQEISLKDSPHVIQIKQFKSGFSFNVIPDIAIIKGVLYSNNTSGEAIVKQIKDICHSISESNHVTALFYTITAIIPSANSFTEYHFIQKTLQSRYKLASSTENTSQNLFYYLDTNQPEIVISSGSLIGSTSLQINLTPNEAIISNSIEMLLYILKVKDDLPPLITHAYLTNELISS